MTVPSETPLPSRTDPCISVTEHYIIRFGLTTGAAMLGRDACKGVDGRLAVGAPDTGEGYTSPVQRCKATQPSSCIFPVINRETSQERGWRRGSSDAAGLPPAPRSVPQREAILARLGAADQHAALPVDLYDLATAHTFCLPFDPVAAAREVGGDLRRDRVLEAQHALEGVAARRVR